MKKLRFLALPVVWLAFAGSAGAILIDDFSNPDAVTTDLITSMSTGAVAVTGSAFDLRTNTIEKTGNGAGDNRFATSVISTGAWSYSMDSLTTGFATLVYGLSSTPPIDFTVANKFSIGVLSSNVLIDWTIEVFDSTAGLSSFSFVSPITGAFTVLDIPFALFVGTANFASVDSITIRVATQNDAGGDISIDFIDATNIPEPATLTLFGGALLGLALLRKRASK